MWSVALFRILQGSRFLTLLLNISEKIAGTIVNAQEPNNPAKNRQIMTVWMSLATATAIKKIPMPVAEMRIGGRLPYSSLIGAQNIGPKAYPSTNSDVPKVVTSCPTLKAVPTAVAAGEKIDEARVAVREVNTRIVNMAIFFFKGQFWGCFGSSGPSNSTMYSSESGS